MVGRPGAGSPQQVADSRTSPAWIKNCWGKTCGCRDCGAFMAVDSIGRCHAGHATQKQTAPRMGAVCLKQVGRCQRGLRPSAARDSSVYLSSRLETAHWQHVYEFEG